MRHLLLTEQWFPNIGGSIQLFDETYGRRFPPGELVHIVGGAAPGDAELDAAYPRPVTRFDARRYEWMKPESAAMYARMTAAALSVARRDRIDVVHCARVIPEGLVAYALHRALGVPYVVWVHGEEVSMYKRYPGKARLMPRIFGAARAVVCNSSFSRERALEAGAPAARVHVVNPGVDAARFAGPFETADLRARYGLEGKTVIVSVGRLTRRKGHDHVLHALARLNRRDVVYLVLSDGELEQELHALARELGLDDVVRWVGPVPGRDVPRYLAASDVFIMANRTLDDGDVEGFGMVFLEASAVGLPVIGGRSGGVVDAVRHEYSGLLVDGGSIDAIAGALARLIDDPALRARLGANGRAWAREDCGWERAAEKLRALCEPRGPAVATTSASVPISMRATEAAARASRDGDAAAPRPSQDTIVQS